MGICIFFAIVYAVNGGVHMHIFDYSFLYKGVLPAELVNLTSTISALNAISEERRGRNATVYTELEKIARIQSVKRHLLFNRRKLPF